MTVTGGSASWQVTAVDYNPAHIAIGMALARAARLDNIHFLEADISQLAGTAEAKAIPAADFVSLHGMWSWVSDEVRAGIVRLLSRRCGPL